MYNPRYIDKNGKPAPARRSFWKRLFGYKPRYESATSPPPEAEEPPEQPPDPDA